MAEKPHEKSTILLKIVQYITVMFLIIFFPFLFIERLVYLNLDQYLSQYFAIYRNAHYILQQEGLPMWAPNLFLGGNFLGNQNSYSIFSPFFLVTTPFFVSRLPRLFLLLVYIKTLLAGFALYLYMRETKWFSKVTIIIALVIYIFNGWYFNFLAEPNFLELLIYVPLSLFGVEHLLAQGRKRYLVFALTLLLVTHFSFTLMFAPFLFFYWWIRFTFLQKETRVKGRVQIRLLLLTVISVLGLSMVFILPMIVASNTVSLRVSGEVTISTMLSALFHTFIPSLHETYSGRLSFLEEGTGQIPLFQTVLVGLLMPQFLKLISPKVRRHVLLSYCAILLFVLLIQTLPVMNVTGLIPFNLNVLSLLFILFNALIVAYVLNDAHDLDINLLKITGRVYKMLLTLLFGMGWVYETSIFHYIFEGSFTLSLFKDQFLMFTPYLLIYLLMFILIDGYRFLMGLMATDNHSLRRRSVFFIFLIECIFLFYSVFHSHNQQSIAVNQATGNQDFIRNHIPAVADFLQAVDPNTHRIINSFQIQAGEPLEKGYNGFSMTNRYQVPDGMLWMLENPDEDGAAISQFDYWITTALSAKYFLTPDSVVPMPGYEFYERIQSITVYRNRYFVPIGTRAKYYITSEDFATLSPEQKRYVFLKAVIIDDPRDANLHPFDLTTIPETISEMQYFEAARFRQSLGIPNIGFIQNRFYHTYTATEATLLVYSIPFDKGWRATSNEKPLVIREVNQGFIGIEIPEAGDYNIILEYRTPGLEIGFGVTLATVFLMVGYFYKQQDEKKKMP